MDHFILADTFQYSRQSFQNRSKLRNPNGWQWISIPLSGHQKSKAIRNVQVNTDDRWQRRHWRAFMYNYRSTMYFEFFEDRLKPFFETEWERLGPCTSRSVELMADLLQVDTPITWASQLDGAPDSVAAVVEAMDAEHLVIPPEADPYDRDAAPTVTVFDYTHPTYHQNFDDFEFGMSAADLLFNYGPESIRTIVGGIE